MDSIVNRLTEIEDAASAIVRHAEEQKEVLDQEYDETLIRTLQEEYEEKHTEYAQEILRHITEV